MAKKWKVHRGGPGPQTLEMRTAAPPAVAPPPERAEGEGLLNLQSAIEELTRLNELAAAAATDGIATPAPTAPAPVAAPPDRQTDLPLLRLSERLEVVIDPPAAAAVHPEAQLLPPRVREAFEIFQRDCPPPLAQQLRKLRARLTEEQGRWQRAGRHLHSVAVVSPRTGSGRSVVARNLAACLGAAPETKVLLIDGDARRPSLHKRVDIPKAPGLAEALQHGAAAAAWTRVPDSGLYLLPLGAVRPALDMLDYPRLAAFLDGLRGQFDWVVVDTPPMEWADAEMICQSTDAALLVLRNQREYFDEAEAAVRRLDSARLLGAILNFAG
ncbi:MAG: CpsD/CapB family tyrosine-protein kinase [Bryobacterales bacterium]|nr:CpsD/CapB family tyrosine-protein kinase [Bryobacterales bacterium]